MLVFHHWKCGRVVECTAFEKRHARKGIGGSNPPTSACEPERSSVRGWPVPIFDLVLGRHGDIFYEFIFGRTLSSRSVRAVTKSSHFRRLKITLFDKRLISFYSKYGQLCPYERSAHMALGQAGHQHFTGTKGGKRVRRKGKGLNKKLRSKKKGTHRNKYAVFSQVKTAPR
jgi:hypothetical protein